LSPKFVSKKSQAQTSSDVSSPALYTTSSALELAHGFRSPAEVRKSKRRVTKKMHRILPLVKIHIGLLAHQVGVAASNTLDLGQGVHDLLLAVNIGIQETQDL
jgi:hypothetical protein